MLEGALEKQLRFRAPASSGLVLSLYTLIYIYIFKCKWTILQRRKLLLLIVLTLNGQKSRVLQLSESVK